jgi:subtilisin family serine protease
VRPIFLEKRSVHANSTAASVEEVAAAIVETIDAGARILNLSAALVEPSSRAERRMHEALDYAARRGAIVVAAAGNQATLGSSAITRHPWVIPVIASDLSGKPTMDSNLSHSAGKRGLAAPGEGIRSLAPNASMQDFAGTSAAVPFVTGACALLWSLFTAATAGQLRFAVTRCGATQRTSVVPPLLDGVDAYQWMLLRQQRSAS